MDTESESETEAKTKITLKGPVGRAILEEAGKRAKTDQKFREQLKSHTKDVLRTIAEEKNHDLQIPETLTITVVEESEIQRYLVIPSSSDLTHVPTNSVENMTGTPGTVRK